MGPWPSLDRASAFYLWEESRESWVRIPPGPLSAPSNGRIKLLHALLSIDNWDILRHFADESVGVHS